MILFVNWTLLLINLSTEFLNSSKHNILNPFYYWPNLCVIDNAKLEIYVTTHVWQQVKKVFYTKIFKYTNNYQIILKKNKNQSSSTIPLPPHPHPSLLPPSAPFLSSFSWNFIHHMTTLTLHSLLHPFSSQPTLFFFITNQPFTLIT